MYMLTAAVSCISVSIISYLTVDFSAAWLIWAGGIQELLEGFQPLQVYEPVDSWRLLLHVLFIYCPSKFYSNKFLFLSVVSLGNMHHSFSVPLRFFSSLLVQFTSVCVPCDTVSKWTLNSSLIFILRNCFNLRAARFRKAASFVSSHTCFLKKFGSLFGQLLSVPVILSNSSMLIISTLSYALPSLSLMWHSDDVTGSRTRISGGIPKIYLKETWNMVCGRWV